MNTYINEIKEYLEKNLSIDLLKKQLERDSERFIKSKAALKNITENLFLKINLFILSGDYVDIKVIDELKKYLTGHLESLMTGIDTDDTEGILLSSFFTPLNHVTKILDSLKSTVNKRMIRSHNQIIIEGRKKLAINHENDYLQISEQLRFLEINCEIVKHDHNLSVKNEHLKKLIVLLIELENTPGEFPLKTILIEKCKILITKISDRMEEDDKNYFYIFEFDEIEIGKFEPEKEIFKPFINHYKFHYKESSKRDRLLEINRTYDSIRTKGYDLKGFHTLIKNYKDDNKSLSQVNNLIVEFDKIYDNIISTDEECNYNKRSWDICKNYLVNNKLSLLMKNKIEKIETITDYLNEIKSIQEKTFVRNYFPYLQFLQFLKSKLKSELDKSKPDFVIANQYLNYYQIYIKDLYKAFDWCQDNDFQAYVLDKDRCIVSYSVDGIGEIKLFLASSFILPLNFKKVNIEIDDLKKAFDEFINHIPLFKRILEEEQQINLTKQEIEKRDRNQVEILGIFSAVVLFAAGGINIFKEAQSIEIAAKYSLIFSYSLSLFVLMIWLITRDHSHFRVHYFHFILLSLIVIATYFIFAISFSFWPL